MLIPIKTKPECLLDIPIHVGHTVRRLAFMSTSNILVRDLVTAEVDKSLQLHYVTQQSHASLQDY